MMTDSSSTLKLSYVKELPYSERKMPVWHRELQKQSRHKEKIKPSLLQKNLPE